MADRNNDGVPDYVENMLYKLETARLLLTESFHLKNPLSSGFFRAKGAKYFDVYIRDIPKENGIASGIVHDDKHEILAGTPFRGKSLKISLHRNLIPRTGTPLHELFHVFQFNYSQFNNPWFMEGLGRWSQSIITKSSGKEEKLPSSSGELDELLNKSHDAEFFWNRLSALCDESGTFVIPEQLSKNDEIANNIRPGAKLIKAVLENTEQECPLIQGKTRSKILAGLAYWPREEKRSPDNNKHIFRAIYNAIDSCTDVRRDELAHFINTILPLINQTSADFDTPAIQNFMLALGKCSGEYIKADMNGILYSDHFDLFTRTLSMHTLDCSNPQLTDADLETFNVLKHVNGSLELRNSNITHLDGFCNIESIKGNLVLGNSGIENISGLSKLRTVNGIELNGMKSLLRISGFNSLKAVSNNINISNNKNLVCINGFNSLEDNGSLEIIENSSLTSISGFNRLLNLNGDLLISKCKKLETLSGLSALRTVKNISINETILADLSNLRNLFGSQKDFPGYIKITANRISSVAFMRGLRSVASSFYLHQNNLANLEGLEALESVGASFSLGANQLNDISQLANLKKINGVLCLSNNRLSTLHGLENLQSLKTTTWNGTPLTIKLYGNEYPDGRISLTDISALANVQEINKNIILNIDANHAYEKTPPKTAIYHTNIIKLILKNRSISTRLSRLSAIESLPAYKNNHKVPILFSNNWQSSLEKCNWLTAFCKDIRDPAKIIEFCKKNDIQLLCANTLKFQYILLNHKNEFFNYGLRFLNNNKFALDRFKDKGLFYNFMSKNNLLEYVPKHYFDINHEDLLGKPFILKTKISTNSEGVKLVLPGEKVNHTYNDLITEYIEGGEEYASNILFKDGEIIKHISYKKIYGNSVYILSPETRGNMKNERFEPSCMNLFEHILSLANPNGGYCLCCIDYKMVNQTPKIFEINARMGYTLVCHPSDFTEMMNVYIEHAYAISGANHLGD